MISRAGWKVRLEFKLQDAWIGVFWRRGQSLNREARLSVRTLEVWICLVPCLPIHITRIQMQEPPLDARREAVWAMLERHLD